MAWPLILPAAAVTGFAGLVPLAQSILRRFFFRHLIPAIAPGSGITAFICFIFSRVRVVLARILTVTGGNPVTTAMTVLSLLPALVLIWFVRKQIARGFTIRT